jgi:hypothetical protein
MCTATLNGQPALEPAQADEWITLAETSRVIRRHVNAVKSIALAGAIRVRAVPGARIQFSRLDAERLANAG